MNRLGQRLASLRAEARLSLEEAAQKVEVQPAQLAAFEAGATRPHRQQLDDLATLYDVTVFRLVAGSVPQPSDGHLVSPETRAFHVGFGRTEEEAQEAKMQAKLAEVPYYPLNMPEDLSIEELEAMVLEVTAEIGSPAFLLNSVLRAVRNDVLPKRRIDALRGYVRDILRARMHLNQLLTH